MKIEKGLTYPQFIKLIESNQDLKPFKRLLLIYRFNDLCQQLLNKGQFIPCDKEGYEIKKPTYEDNALSDGCLLKEFEAAEKKVIFKDWEYFRTQKDCVNRIHVEFKKSIFPYADRLGIMIPKNKTLHTHFNIVTIADLFHATNGETELKNIEL